ncbi:MAG: hypothetical protein ABI442_05435, partial [Gemmatimonadaceae bacterium]
MTAVFWGAALSRDDGSTADGIHLLWTAPYAAGYSLSGYDIQRRASRWKPNITCYTLTRAELDILQQYVPVTTSVGVVTVSQTPCPKLPPDLPNDPYTGGGGGDTGKLQCVDFSKLSTKNHAAIDTIDGLSLVAFDTHGRRRPHVLQRTIGNMHGVDVVERLDISLPAPSRRVVVTLVSFAKAAKLTALDVSGRVLASKTFHALQRHAGTITLAASGIARVRIDTPSDETLLLRFCWETGGAKETKDVAGLKTHAMEATGPSDQSAVTQTAVIGPTPSISSDARASLGCFRYRIVLDGPHQVVEVGAQVSGMIAIALREGQAVDSRYVASTNGLQAAIFFERGADEVLIYTGVRVAGLTVCIDVPPSPAEEAKEWGGVPYIARGIQLPARAVNAALSTASDERALADSRLLAGETLDPSAFADIADTLDTTASAGPASPMWYTMRVREKLTDPFIETRPWQYALSLTIDAAVRRALGFGYLDKGAGLTSGSRYDYRITGHFLRRDIEEQLFAFHTIPSTTTLPATFHLDRVRVSTPSPSIVELYPAVPATALRGTSRKGIAFSPSGLLPPSVTLGFDVPVMRVVLELEPATTGTVSYSAKTTDFIVGLSGTVFTGTIVGAPRVTIDFAEPIDTLELRGSGFLYGVRLPSPTAGDPTDVIDSTVILPAVQYTPTSPPAPPPSLGTQNLQQPILEIDPAVTTQQAPEALGFTLRWVPPAIGSSTVAPWPTDLGAVPPFDVAGFLLERRRVDTSGPFVAIGDSTLPTVFFGNRGARSDPPQLYFGMDMLLVFPEVSSPTPPVDPWISVNDVLHSAGNPSGPPPGSLHQYRVSSIDAIGRHSTTPTTGSVVRLEKHIAPPPPVGPEETLAAGTVRPPGVRARVLQKSDPDLADDDVTLLGASTNAIVLEWGWTATERARDEYAAEFRVYWNSLPPDVVNGTLHDPASLVGAAYEMSCTFDQAVAADAMKGRYVLSPTYPFKVAGHGAGTNITMQLEPSVLHPEIVPSSATFTFTPILTGAEQRPAAWQERSAVIAIGA